MWTLTIHTILTLTLFSPKLFNETDRTDYAHSFWSSQSPIASLLTNASHDDTFDVNGALAQGFTNHAQNPKKLFSKMSCNDSENHFYVQCFFSPMRLKKALGEVLSEKENCGKWFCDVLTFCVSYRFLKAISEDIVGKISL